MTVIKKDIFGQCHHLALLRTIKMSCYIGTEWQNLNS